MDAYSTKLFLIYAVIFFFYIPFFFIWQKRSRSRYARKKFCRGILSILDSCKITEECISQVLMLYKRLAERYGDLDVYFRSATEMLEDLVITIDTQEEKSFKETYGIDSPKQYRERMISMIHTLKKLQPFSSLSSKQGNLLNMLNHAIEHNNPDLAKSSLNQLSDEMEVLEGNVRRQENRNKISFIVSIIGIILTIFFGALSFINLLK